MIHNLSPKTWPFETKQFGNLEQINFLKLEAEKETQRNKIKINLEKGEWAYVETAEAECEGGCGCDIEIFVCPECDAEGNDFDDLIEKIQFGEVNVNLCKNCGLQLKEI